jgi:UDP:flavonoid glycosyltransferase YjiC (YdhE family)
MARILIATVPLSGHVNPGLPIARRLVANGHEVRWYCGQHFRDTIEATGAVFEPFRRAKNFYDLSITEVFGKVPMRSLLAHSSYYIRKVFYNPMPAYYADIKDLLSSFDADVILSDEWFTGGIPFSELKTKPWIIYGNSPLMMVSGDAPPPGSGLLPAPGLYGKNRDRIVNAIARLLFIRINRHINNLRREVGLPGLTYFFAEQNIRFSTLTLKFSTTMFEFPRTVWPAPIRFVGPVMPENTEKQTFSWLETIIHSKQPTIFITQGSVDVNDIQKLIIPALKALHDTPVNIIISTGGKDTALLKSAFPGQNTFIEKHIPYCLIMPYLAMMITNGGYGGVSTSLRHGVPIIIAGNSEDKPEIASRLRYCGAGIDLRTGRPSPRSIRNAVMEILHNDTYKNQATRIMEDFKTHDAVKESVYLLEALLKEGE